MKCKRETGDRETSKEIIGIIILEGIYSKKHYQRLREMLRNDNKKNSHEDAQF